MSHLSSFSKLHTPTPIPLVLPVFPPQPISREICANLLSAFSGFGQHTMNDFLFGEAIFPGMPSYLLCKDDRIFEDFVSIIEAYLKSFTTNEFYNKIVSITNLCNPFAFNDKSHEQYMYEVSYYGFSPNMGKGWQWPVYSLL